MKKLIPILAVTLLAAAGVSCSPKPSDFSASLPTELVGEWKTIEAFPGGAYSILDLRRDGLLMIMGGPPPIGTGGLASYSPQSHTLTLSLRERGVERGRLSLTYDSNTKTLGASDRGQTVTYKRISEVLPKYLESMDRKKVE